MRPALALVPLVLFASCAAGPEEEPTRRVTLVFLKTGPKSGSLSKEENAAAFQGHFANMGRLAEERKLLVAGPFGKVRHDPALRGLFVLDTPDAAQALEWAGTDPAVRAGIFVLECHALETAADLPGALERDLQRLAQAKAEGRTPPPGEGARPWALLIVEDADRAWPHLVALTGQGVCWKSRLDGSRALVLLDAKDAADAKALYPALLEAVGAHTLDDWFASAELARLHGSRVAPDSL